MINFLTYHDGTEPFKSMAKDLCDSVAATGAGECAVMQVEPNGGHYLIEFYSAIYPLFSQMIQHGPVVVLDSDCIVKKPFDHLFEGNFNVAAIHRGACSNSMGTQDFLGSLIGFHPADPVTVRMFWHMWMSNVYQYLDKPVVTAAAARSEDIVATGWHKNWYGGQAAYNDILYSGGFMVKKLDRDEYSAHPKKLDAYVHHMKGERKLR